MHAASPLVSIVLVNYNGRDFLEPCLHSLLDQTYQPIEIILVDNGSTDGSVELAQTRFPSVTIVESERNLGFAEGNNAGFAQANGEYVALLNNDTVVEENWLSTLVDRIRNDDLALVCSQVITDGVPGEFYSMNGTLNYLGHNIMRHFRDLTQVFYASAASLLVRRDILNELFPDEYFLYQEDVYLSWKLRLLGHRIAMVPESRVHHRGSQSTKRETRELVGYYQERNRILNCLIFYQMSTLLRLVPYFVFDFLAKLAMALVGRGKPLKAILRAYFWPLTNAGWVQDHRRGIQSTRKLPDREVLSLMSPKVSGGQSFLSRVLNGISSAYASAVRLNPHG
ncbi:MAG: glycosyltransferase family 2 protein [Bacteroidota bacterium]